MQNNKIISIYKSSLLISFSCLNPKKIHFDKDKNNNVSFKTYM